MLNYTVESDFIYENHRCVVIFGSNGYRCGYVGVDENSPLYGMNASDSIEVDMTEFRKEPLGKRGVLAVLSLAFRDEQDSVPLSAYFDVHGGITYAAGDFYYPVKSMYWWFGFDCGHNNDGIDLDTVKENWGRNPIIMNSVRILERCNPYRDFPVRSKEYCEEECKSLTNQIIKLEHKLKLSH